MRKEDDKEKIKEPDFKLLKNKESFKIKKSNYRGDGYIPTDLPGNLALLDLFLLLFDLTIKTIFFVNEERQKNVSIKDVLIKILKIILKNVIIIILVVSGIILAIAIPAFIAIKVLE